MTRNVPDFNLGLNASQSFAQGGSIASQIIENRLRQQQQTQNYDIQNRQVALQEQEYRQKMQQQQAFERLAVEAYEKPDAILPHLYAKDPAAAAKISDNIQQKYSSQYNSLNLITKDTKAEDKQAVYDILKPELQRQFPELEFGDKYSSELNSSLKNRAAAIKSKIKTNLEFRDTAQGIVGFDPATGEGKATGFAPKPFSMGSRPAVLQIADEIAASSGGKITKANAILMAGKFLNKENIIDPETGQIVKLGGATDAATQTKQAEKLGTDLGEVQAKALGNLGNVEDNANFLLRELDQIKVHPGLKGSVGLKGGGALFGNIGSEKIFPGSPEADFVSRMGQIEGEAFLQAFDTLKGGGQITEAEGKKATQARLRMSRATSEKDFIAAANDFEDVVRTGLERQRKQAKGEFGTNIKQENKTSNKTSGIKFLGFE